MMRLTRVELRRLFSRRLTVIAVLGTLVITGLMLFGSFIEAKPLSGEELAAQQTMIEQVQKDWEATGEQQVQECLKMQADMQKADPKADMGCNQMQPNPEQMGKPLADFPSMMKNNLIGGAYLLAFVSFLIGAGFVAAEFSSGSIGNWLTFEPRRMRVYASKLAAAGLGLIPVTVALLGLLTVGVWLIVGHYAPTGLTTTTKEWGDLAQIAGRSVALAVTAAVVGAASGALLRHTAAVLGIAAGYLILVEGIFGQSLQAARPWLLQLNFEGWLQHGTTYFGQVCKTDSQGLYGCQGVEKALSFGHSTAYLGLLVVFVVGLAALVFRRRDVS